MKILYSGFRYNGHSAFGGYDWITKYPNSDYLSDKDSFLGFLPSGKSGKVLNLFCLDRKTRRIANQYDIVHCFYGDYTIVSKFPKNRNYSVVATIHQNIDLKIPHHKNIITCLQSLDDVITLSSQQAKSYKEKYGLKTVFIPHGFNKPIFDTLSNEQLREFIDIDKINIVCIGRQYRDSDTLFSIINSVKQKHDIVFHLVGSDEYTKDMLANSENVIIHKHLDDRSYYSLIQNCDWCFMPLTYATANNALMEAHSLGVRCILPNIDGVLDYACKDENFYYENLDKLLYFFNKITKQEKSQKLIDYSTCFSWDNVYKKLSDFYSKITTK